MRPRRIASALMRPTKHAMAIQQKPILSRRKSQLLIQVFILEIVPLLVILREFLVHQQASRTQIWLMMDVTVEFWSIYQCQNKKKLSIYNEKNPLLVKEGIFLFLISSLVFTKLPKRMVQEFLMCSIGTILVLLERNSTY